MSAVAEAFAGEEESEDAGEFKVISGLCAQMTMSMRSLTGQTFFFLAPSVLRLTATLAFLVRLSPFYEDQLVPLLSVLQACETSKGKRG